MHRACVCTALLKEPPGNGLPLRVAGIENVPKPTFDELLTEGAAVDVSTWGAGFLSGHYVEEPPPWDYTGIVAPYLHDATTMLDMGTGSGLDSDPVGRSPCATAQHRYADFGRPGV